MGLGRRGLGWSGIGCHSFLDDFPLMAPILTPPALVVSVVNVGQLPSGRRLSSSAFQPFPKCLLEPLIPMK